MREAICYLILAAASRTALTSKGCKGKYLVANQVENQSHLKNTTHFNTVISSHMPTTRQGRASQQNSEPHENG
jgi:hypothetical protein